MENQHPDQQNYNQNYNQNYGNPNPPQMPPKTWLVESILVTILCCLPFGIVGIVQASRVESAFYANRFEEAERASREAKRWTMLGFWIGLGVGLLYLIVYAVLIFVGVTMKGFDF